MPVLLIGEIKVAKAGLQLLKQGKSFGIAAQLLQYACQIKAFTVCHPGIGAFVLPTVLQSLLGILAGLLKPASRFKSF